MKHYHMLITRIFILGIIHLGIISCSGNKEIDLHLGNIQKSNKSIPVDGWKLVRYFNDDRGIGYDLTRDSYNENSRLCFHHDKKNDKYFIEYFIKKYRDNQFAYNLEINQADTLYFYKSPLKDLNTKIFIMGEYQFLYMHNKLNPGQREYFRIHSDSLREIKGDNLPLLPSAKAN